MYFIIIPSLFFATVIARQSSDQTLRLILIGGGLLLLLIALVMGARWLGKRWRRRPVPPGENTAEPDIELLQDEEKK